MALKIKIKINYKNKIEKEVGREWPTSFGRASLAYDGWPSLLPPGS
jgi:hypothetical protein